MSTLLTVEQYAIMTQLHPDSVRRQLRSGRLRAIKKGRVWRIPSDEVRADSRASDAVGSWASAAKEMAGVYSQSLSEADELTAMTTAPGGFYETGDE